MPETPLSAAPHPVSALPAAADAALDTLLSRRSCWPLVEPGPDDAALRTIFDAALRAPDNGRLRPWRFILVRGAAREALGEIMVDIAHQRAPGTTRESHRHRAQRATVAPVMIALGASVDDTSGIPEVEQLLSVGAATMNMLNAVHALGLGGFWVTGPDSYDPALRRALGFEAQERVLGFLFVGTPRNALRTASRPARADHVREWFGPQRSAEAFGDEAVPALAGQAARRSA